MTDRTTLGAWGHGLATVSAATGRVLDTWYPDPGLGPADRGDDHSLADTAGADELRGVRREPVTSVIADLDAPPADVPDAHLPLHLLPPPPPPAPPRPPRGGRRRPRGPAPGAICGLPPAVAWPSHGPVDPAALPAARHRALAAG